MTKKKPVQEYSFVGIKVTDYTAAIDAAVNYRVRDLKNHRCDDDENVYKFDSRIEIAGSCLYPEEQEGTPYYISIGSNEPQHMPFDLKLKDCHVITDLWTHKYKTVRGQQVPVYDIPKDVGYLERARRNGGWRGAVWVPDSTINSMLTLLASVKPLYIQLHKLKIERSNLIAGFTLQTDNPAEN